MAQIDHRKLETWAKDVLLAVELSEPDAEATASGLVRSNLRGVVTHGVFRLMQYTSCVRNGEINATPNVKVLQRKGATALVDAGGGYGYRPAALAMDIATEIAETTGIGIVGVRNSHHFGAAAIYTGKAAEREMIGFGTTTTRARMGPPGVAEGVVGNNPISYAIPRQKPHPPIILDMALSEVAMGKIRVASAEGTPIPPHWGYNSNGDPTTVPDEVLYGGMLAPIGTYKGYGLSVIVELIAGVLTGSRFGLYADNHSHHDGGVGHLFIAIEPDFFGEKEDFFAGVEDLVQQIMSRPLAPGVDRVYLPGEIEYLKEQEQLKNGVQISDGIAQQLNDLARELGVAEPEWTTGQGTAPAS